MERVDLLLYDARALDANAEPPTLLGPRFVAVDHIDEPPTFAAYQQLLQDSRYELVALNTVRRGGFAIFERAARDSMGT